MMNDMIQNPEAQKLAQMLQQQQMQRFLQANQGASPMSNADMQTSQMSMISPQNNYQMPYVQQNLLSNMPLGAGSPRRGLMQGAISDMDRRNMMQQGKDQGAISNSDYQSSGR